MNKRQTKKAKKKQMAIIKFIELKHKYENIYHFAIWSEWHGWLKGDRK